MSGPPWAFHPHVAAWAVVAGTGTLCGLAGRLTRPRFPGGEAWTRRSRRQRWQLGAGLVSLAVALTWPVADLAAHWSLTALLAQRLVLVLAAAPLLLLSFPRPVLARLTRPVVLDAAVERLSRPPVAVAFFTVVVVGTLATPAVALQASSAPVRGLFDGLLLCAGLVLWVPVLGTVPGAHATSPVGRAAYLVVQSVLPNFPAVVFIFAHHPLYGAFLHAHRAIGLSPVGDQQLAGVVAKVATLPVLWTAAYRALARAQRAEERDADEETLYWADVERALERSERAERSERVERSERAERAGPRPAADGPGT